MIFPRMQDIIINNILFKGVILMGDSAAKCYFVDFIIHSKGDLLLQGVTCNSHNLPIFQSQTSHQVTEFSKITQGTFLKGYYTPTKN